MTDALLIKTDASGNTVWTKTFGGAGITDIEYFESVLQTSDGGYIAAGTNNTGTGSWAADFYLVKTDSAGNPTWSTHTGTATYSIEYGHSIVQTTDGGYAVLGTSWNVDIYLVKTNSVGVPVWTQRFLNAGIGYSIEQTSDGGFIIAGTTLVGDEVCLIKTDSAGNPLWTKTFGDASEAFNEARSVKQTSDGGYVIASFTGGKYFAGNIYLTKTDPAGNIVWTKHYPASGDEKGYSVQQTADGGYIIAGKTNSFGNGYNVYLIKTDSAGNIVWTKNFGGIGDDEGYSVWQTSDGGYVIVGDTYSFGAVNSDVYLIKTDANGNVAGY